MGFTTKLKFLTKIVIIVLQIDKCASKVHRPSGRGSNCNLICNPINVRKEKSLIHLFRIYGEALIELIIEDYTLQIPQSILTTP